VSRDPAWPVYLVEAVPAGLEEVTLGGDEGRHAASVRRHRVGEWLVATDGAGRWAAGPVGQVIGRDRLVIDVHLRGAEPTAEPALTVVQALPKSDRADAAVESLTAVGVDRIVPWQASRCVTRWSADRVDRGIRRWRRTAAEAAKQSRRVWLPDVTELRDLTGVLTTEVVAAEAVFVCHERATTPLATAAVPSSGRIVLVIGPEGGLTDDEVTSLEQAGGRAVSLGPTVLRSAAAGMVAATLVLGAAGRLG
jgi:16S rRNA (uracil1498-N3)-methyltransferase